MEQGFRSRTGVWTVSVAISGWAHRQAITSSAGRSRSQKCGVSSQNSIPSRPVFATNEKISSLVYSWKNMLETP